MSFLQLIRPCDARWEISPASQRADRGQPAAPADLSERMGQRDLECVPLLAVRRVVSPGG